MMGMEIIIYMFFLYIILTAEITKISVPVTKTLLPEVIPSPLITVVS